MAKWNTFLDFKACATHLIELRLTTPSLLCGSFGSAGGLIGGVLINHFPELFRAIVMRSPSPSSSHPDS
jgi:oligopeptidase B